MLWSIGTYTWLLCIVTIVCLLRKRPVLCKLLLIMQILTLLIAAPVVDFRYGYAVVMTMPLWISVIESNDVVSFDGKRNR